MRIFARCFLLTSLFTLFFSLGMEVHRHFFGSVHVLFWQDKTSPFEKVTYLDVMLPAKFGEQHFQSCPSAMKALEKFAP